MDCLECEGALRGGFCSGEKRRIVIVSLGKFCKATVNHPRILITKVAPSAKSPLKSVGAVIFASPFRGEDAESFCTRIGKEPRVIIWRRAFKIIEPLIFDVLERNKPRKEKKTQFPELTKLPELPKLSATCKEGGLYGREFIQSNADPMATDFEADIRRIHSLIPKGPWKPGLPTIRKNYHYLVRKELLGLARPQLDT